MNFIIGGTGLIGSEIIRQFAIPDDKQIAKSIYHPWWDSTLQKSIYEYLARSMPEGGNLFIASGLIDQSYDNFELLKVNFQLPRNIIEVANKLGIKTHTFGTIQEYLKTENPYLNSKKQLASFLEENGSLAFHTHYRLHTLYGGKNPKEFMFLSKLSDSIKLQKPFLMSSGKQLREFHHVEDDVAALKILCTNDSTGFIDINHGKEMHIGDFALAVLMNYGLSYLLEIGVYPDPKNENYKLRFPRIALDDSFKFRDPVSGFIDFQNSMMNS